jgi:replicative DNA helicase
VRQEALVQAIDMGVRPEHFVDPEHQRVWDWVLEHFGRYAKCPGESALKSNFPTYKTPATPEPIEYYVREFHGQRVFGILAEKVSAAGQILDGQPTDADLKDVLALLRVAMEEAALGTSVSKDRNLVDPQEVEQAYDFYEDLVGRTDSLRGYSTGFHTIDLATMGLQSKQMVTLVGPPKGGKSSILMNIAEELHHQDLTVMIVSFEMSFEELQARWFGRRAALNYRRLLKGQMSDHDRERIDLVLDEVSDGTEKPMIISEAQHKPDVVLVDGVYMMDDEYGEPKGSSAAITNITRGLKRAALTTGLPFLITTQVLFSKMRGSSIEANSIGYSSSYGQDSDVVIAVEPRPHPDIEGAFNHFIKVLLTRAGPRVECQINFDWQIGKFDELVGLSDDAIDPDLHDPDTGPVVSRRLGMRERFERAVSKKKP